MKKSRIFALMLVLVMCSSNIVFATSLAASSDNNVGVHNIRKVLRMPRGTITPDVTFEFKAEKVSLNENTSDAARNRMPELNTANLTVSFSQSDRNEPVNNIISLTKETGNIFEGVNFENGGVYVYRISERDDTNDAIEDNPNELLYYSKAVYNIEVHVDEDLKIKGVAIRVEAEDRLENSPKVSDKVVQMVFTNDFVRTNVTTDPINNSTLYIGSNVSGNIADRTRFFQFNMTVNAAPLLVGEDIPAFYKAYVVENNAVIHPGENADASILGTADGTTFIRISTSGTTRFGLRHGQRLVFVDTPVGTSYTTIGLATEGHIPGVVVTTNNVVVFELQEEEPNVELSTELRWVGELLNRAVFTNSRTSVVPTGVNINDMPFFGLVALPLGALIAFVGIKSRRKNDESCK